MATQRADSWERDIWMFCSHCPQRLADQFNSALHTGGSFLFSLASPAPTLLTPLGNASKSRVQGPDGDHFLFLPQGIRESISGHREEEEEGRSSKDRPQHSSSRCQEEEPWPARQQLRIYGGPASCGHRAKGGA